ncbi:MAG: argininosuccinate synthase, partial [Elusimicrobia bacterium]|nr:argininosuccinate synthase [Elusimicrobiota bacterium]
MKKPKIVLAFSGGLDTTFCVLWLQKELNADVLTVTVDTGGF